MYTIIKQEAYDLYQLAIQINKLAQVSGLYRRDARLILRDAIQNLETIDIMEGEEL